MTTPEYRSFEASLGLPERFLLDLFKQDDWSFVIKLHALVETALTRALVAHFNAPPTLADHFAQIPVGGTTGKIKLASKCGLITPKDKTFLDRFAELRNELVHSVERVRFDFKIYVNSLSEEGRKQLVAAVREEKGQKTLLDDLLRDPHSTFLARANPVLLRLAQVVDV